MLFEPVDGIPCGFTSTKIKIKDIGNGIFQVIFIVDAHGVHKEQSCKCYLAFKEGLNYNNAMKAYQKKYKSLLDEREKIKIGLELQWKNYYYIKQQYSDLGLLNLFNDKDNLYNEEKITRLFQLNGFGLINCDYPTPYPQGAELTSKYKDTKGNTLTLNNIVLIEKGRNAIFRYTTRIKFNPQKENILWGITTNNRLAYLKSDDFKKIKNTFGDYTFTMNVYPKILKTYEDVCKVLF